MTPNEVKMALQLAKKQIKRIVISILIKVLVIVLIVILIASALHLLTLDSAETKEGDWSSVPYAASQFKNDITIDEDGNIITSMTPQEIWNKVMAENNGNIDTNLENPEDFAKLLHAELTTQFPDTRENPDEPIDWESFFEDSAESNTAQGIIKFIRENEKGKSITMSYVSPSEFQSYIDDYTETGSEEAKTNALNHFTIEQEYDFNYDLSGDSVDESEFNTENGYTEFKQSKYTETEYASGTIATAGCMPTSMAIILSGLGITDSSGKKYTPSTLITQGVMDTSKSNDSKAKKAFKKLGLQTKTLSDKKEILEQLKQGHPILIHASPGYYTERGHYMALINVKDNQVYLSNPSGKSKNGWVDIDKLLSRNVDRYIAVYKEGVSTSSIKGKEEKYSAKSNSKADKEKVKKQIMSFLASKGVPGVGIAAICGNIQQESGFNPSSVNSIGCSGLCQWYKGRLKNLKKYAASKGKPWTDVDSQLEFLWKELNGSYKKVLKVIMSSTDLEYATWYFARYYEVPWTGTYNAAGKKKAAPRIKYAKSAAEYIKQNGIAEYNAIDSSTSGTAGKYYVKVATWEEIRTIVTSNDPEEKNTDETDYYMQTTSIDYQNAVSNYTMPFNYLWDLLLTSESQKFVEEVAELVFDSQIEITIHDNLSVNTNINKETYKRKIKRKETASLVTVSENLYRHQKSSKVSESETITKTYTRTIKTITKTNTIDMAVTRANVWIVDYNKKYEAGKPVTTTDNPTTTKLEDIEEDTEKTEGTTGELTEAYVKDLNQQNKENGNTDYTYIENNKVEETKSVVERTETIDNKTTTTEYVSSPAKIREKTEKNPSNGEKNFVSLICEYENRDAYSSLDSAGDWLIEILEKNEDTKSMVDLTKYLLYKIFDEDYGVTSFDFSVFEPGSLEPISGLYGASVEEKIWWAVINAGFSKEAAAGVLGNIYAESGFKSNNVQNSCEKRVGSDTVYTEKVNNGSYSESSFSKDEAGYGLCQWTSEGRKKGLYKYSKSKGVGIDDEDMQIEYLIGEIKKGSTASGYASFQMSSPNKGYSYNSWKTATSPEDAAVAFCYVFERPGDPNLKTRKTKAREYYDKYKNATQNTSVYGNSFLATAKKCHDYLRANNYYYPSAANIRAGRYVSDGKSKSGKLPVIGEPASKRYVDCSAYVSWVLTTYGYKVHTNAAGLMKNPAHLRQVPLSQVQAGDILVRNGHTEIYAGNGKSYNCGSTNAIRSKYTNCNNSRIHSFSKAFRVNK